MGAAVNSRHSRWSLSPRAGVLAPTIVALLHDADVAARRNRPLYFCKTGFRCLFKPRATIHHFTTVRAAERRGLVISQGEGHKRRIYITGLGLDTLARLERKAA